jgi:hypothetical protein
VGDKKLSGNSLKLLIYELQMQTDTFYKTRIVWKNINHDRYNMTLENAVFLIFACHLLLTTAKAQIHFLSGVLTHSFQLANKSLPQGHRTSPTICCPHYLESYLMNAMQHGIKLFHIILNKIGRLLQQKLSFCHETHKVQTEYWCSYCNDLSYSTDATQVTKTLDSLTDMTFPETSTNILCHPITNAKLYTPEQQANAHHSYTPCLCFQEAPSFLLSS